MAEIVANNLSAGVHQYQFDGKNQATGVYYYQIVAGEYRGVSPSSARRDLKKLTEYNILEMKEERKLNLNYRALD